MAPLMVLGGQSAVAMDGPGPGGANYWGGGGGGDHPLCDRT